MPRAAGPPRVEHQINNLAEQLQQEREERQALEMEVCIRGLGLRKSGIKHVGSLGFVYTCRQRHLSLYHLKMGPWHSYDAVIHNVKKIKVLLTKHCC